MAVCETFTKGNRFIVGILFKIFIDPSIPDKHGAATILVFRYDPFEIRLLDRMILGGDSQALLARIGGRPFRKHS